MIDNEMFMRQAIASSRESVRVGGGPFGAVIVKDGEVVATGSNKVTLHIDPTAHAEIMAIREAAAKLKTFDLSGCVIYSSCEPCPMCLGAIYWAHIGKLYYGNSKADAQAIGFGDAFIYKELELSPEKRQLHMEQLLPREAIEAFDAWKAKPDKIEY